MKPPMIRPTMKPKIQLEAEALGSATSSGWSSEIGPSTMISGVPSGSSVGTSMLSMDEGAAGRLVDRPGTKGLRVGFGPGLVVGASVGATVGVGSGLVVGLAVWHHSRFSPSMGEGFGIGSQWSACDEADARKNAPSSRVMTAASRPRRLICRREYYSLSHVGQTMRK